MTEFNEFEQAAIARDLSRRPEVKAIALALAKINSPRNVKVNPAEIPPIYITLAYHLVNRKEERAAFLMLLEILS